MGEAQPPAGNGVGLAEAVDHERLRIVAGRRDERPVVAEVAVDFVAQQHDVPLGGQLGDAANFFLRGHDPRGIGGAVEDDHLRPRRDRGRHAVQVDAEVGIGVDIDDLRPGHGRQGVVHHEVRVEDDHLVARVQEHEHRQHDAAAGAAGDEQLAIGMAELPVDFALQLLPQDRHALRQGIAVLAAFDRGDRRLADRLRRLEIGLADGEVDRIGELRARSKTLRIPEASNRRVRSASQWEDME